MASSFKKQKRGGPRATADVAAQGPLPPAALSEHLASPDAVAALRAAFHAATPFRHAHVRGVLPDALLTAARDELLRGTYYRKRNDLYDFVQSDDLKLTPAGTATAAVRDTLYSPAFRAWITAVTGVETLPTIDASAAMYGTGGHLLCHDDDLAARRIAYILYLVPRDWDVRVDGGSLDLFDTTRDGRAPHRIVRRLAPEWNSLAFFDVTHASHHQVAEVLSDVKGPRLSISGWFHGTPVPRPPPPAPPSVVFIAPPAPPRASAADPEWIVAAAAAAATGDEQPRAEPPPSAAAADAAVDGDDDAVLQALTIPSEPMEAALVGAPDPLRDWISPRFLTAAALRGMRERFAETGAMKLVDFLLPARYAAVMRATPVQRWTRVGPPNIANYRAALTTATAGDAVAQQLSSGGGDGGDDDDGVSGGLAGGIEPDVARRLFNFVTGGRFLRYIVAATGAPLGAVAGALRCFAHGDYTLIADPEYRAEGVRAKAVRVLGAGGGMAQGEAVAGDSGRGGAAPQERKAGAAADDDDDASSGGDSAVPTVDVALFLVPPLGCGADGEWPDAAGGFTTFLTADEEVASVAPQPNTLSLVLVPQGVMSFVKFVTAAAPAPRCDVSLRFAAAEVADA